MTVRQYIADRFSPYLDPDPWADFYDDMAQRGTTVVALVLAVHVGLFFMLQSNFIVPDLKDDPEPDPIPVTIITFAEPAPVPDPEPGPEVIDVSPVVPAATAAPAPRPVPKPQPEPQPTPPPPAPEPVIEPEPEQEPEIIVTPSAPEILTTEAREPEETVSEIVPPPIEVAPVVEPPVVEPEPIVEIFEPLPEPIIEPTRKPIPVPEFQIEIFEPEPEVVIEPEPEIIQEPLPADPLPVAPIITPEPLDTPPTAGALIEPVVEPEIDAEPLPVAPVLPTPEPEVPIAIEPAPIEPDEDPDENPEDNTLDTDLPIITTAPTIIASPDAPTTPEQSERAVPLDQAAPVTDFLFNPRTPSRPNSNTPTGGVSLGGGGGPPSGGTQRPSGTSRAGPSSGGGGWTLAPGTAGGGQLGEGGVGIVMDMRCREFDRTHQDCPEYTAKYKGRNAAGFETFAPHSTGGIANAARSSRSGTEDNQAVGGGRNPWTAAIGDNSVNAGGPQGSVLDDADFGRTFLGTDLTATGGASSRVRDVFSPPPDYNAQRTLTLPTADDEDDVQTEGIVKPEE